MAIARMSAAATRDRPVRRERRIAEPDHPKLDTLAAMWTRVGVLFATRPTAKPVDLERLLLETARAARFDERLFVCAASWLAQYHGFINGRRLSVLAVELDHLGSATLGALLSLARDAAGNAPELDAALARCRQLSRPRPLFAVMDTMDVLAGRMRTRALPLFVAWGLWHDDATLKPSAIRPVRWLLNHAPELRARALLGPSVEADLMASALAGEVTVRDVALTTHVSYAATHDAASRLVSRGLLVRERVAQRQLLRPTAAARAALDQSE
jgi:hypothetical protein